MLEIIIMIGVVGWFARTAKQIGRNGVAWGAMGALSYYVPMLVCSWLIFPAILRPFLTYDNQTGLQLLDVALSVLVGIGCCVALRQILSAQLRAQQTAPGQHANQPPPIAPPPIAR
jgi:hypothetical protein